MNNNALKKRFDDDGNRVIEVYEGDLNEMQFQIDVKNNELAYLYGQEKIPSQYKESIKKAKDT